MNDEDDALSQVAHTIVQEKIAGKDRVEVDLSGLNKKDKKWLRRFLIDCGCIILSNSSLPFAVIIFPGDNTSSKGD